MTGTTSCTRKPNSTFLRRRTKREEAAVTELRDLIESIDIVAYLSQFVDLEQRGEEYWGLSPFKDEKTPSFSVRPKPPCFFDYSSGIGGNVFTFTKYYFHCSATEAVEKLKEYAGEDGETGYRHEKLEATKVCMQFLPKKTSQKESSGIILPDNVMEKYENKPDKLEIWRQEGISNASMVRFQVMYDSFSNRIVYPIRNPDGKIVNVGGRTLDPAWKEKKLRKYTYFYPWGTMDTIYGISENMEEIKKQNEIILFEGCKSVLIADSWGISNTGAILTSHLNPNQLKILAKLGCDTVFALDKDVDIRKDHNIQKLRQYCRVEYLYDKGNLLEEKDSPVDRGEEVFHRLYERRIRYR